MLDVTGSSSEITFDDAPRRTTPDGASPDISLAERELGWRPAVAPPRRSGAHARVVPDEDLSSSDAAGHAARWSAVVVSYESGDLLTHCVQSIADDESAGAPDIVVVDNGSSDGSVAALQAARPGLRVLEPGHNVGYAAAANLGIAATSAPVIAVCNADVRLIPGTARAMVRRLDDEPDLAAVGPAVLRPDGSTYPSARRVPGVGDAVGHALLGTVRPDNSFTRRYRELDADPAVARDVDWVSGAAIWLRRSALQAVDGWDARYFMYVEDVDLCWRLRQAGWRVAYEPSGRVVHVQGASTARHPYRMIVAHHRSLLRFAAKRWHGWRKVLVIPAAGFLALRAGFAVLVRAVHAIEIRRGSRVISTGHGEAAQQVHTRSDPRPCPSPTSPRWRHVVLRRGCLRRRGRCRAGGRLAVEHRGRPTAARKPADRRSG